MEITFVMRSSNGSGAEAFGGWQANQASLLRLAARLHLWTRDYQGTLLWRAVLHVPTRTRKASDVGPARRRPGVGS